MSFTHDRRGQSVVIGTVIVFGFLILALSVYQVQFVPAENSEIEFEHSQAVEGDFLDLRNALLTAGRTGEARSTSIRLGTRYPQRTFFLNPPPASGELSTTEQNDLVIRDASVAGSNNVEKYWESRVDEDENIPFETRSIRYSPNYNEFQNGPDLIYEHSLVVAEFDNTVVSRTDQTAVRGDGDRISLTMVDGDLSISATERRSLDPETLSQQRRTVTLQPDDGIVTLVLPTAVESDTKRDDLADEWEAAIEADVNTSVEGEAIRIDVETEDSMQLALSQVGLGSGTSATDETDGYITNVSERDGVAVAEVRDRFNNPVEEAEVEIDINDDGTADETKSTDEDGRVEYAVNEVTHVEMHINGIDENDPDWESVLFRDLGIADRSSGVGNQTFNVEWERPPDPRTVNAGEDDERITINVTDRDPNLDTNIENASVDVSVGVIEGSGPTEVSFPDGSETDENGEVEISLDVSGNEVDDEFDLYASAGDDVDRLRVEVVSDDDNGDPAPPPIQNGIQYEGGLTSTGTGSAIQFDIRNVGGDFARVESVRVDSRIGAAAELYNGNNGRIIEITGGDSDGFRQTEGGGNPSSRAIAADGTSIDLTQNAVLSTSGGGDDATVSVKQFGTASGNTFNQYNFDTLNRVTEDDDWDVEIVLEFQNRDDVVFYFEE